jgi:hypothetical protein
MRILVGAECEKALKAMRVDEITETHFSEDRRQSNRRLFEFDVEKTLVFG